MTQPHATLLIVDDTPTNLALLFKALEREGYRVLVNTSGEAALHTAQKILPDIIMLDVMMPGIDGFETCQRLKSNPATADIPVIFLTALTDTVDKVKGFRLGAVDYVTKPIEMAELLARVKTHLTLRQLRVQLEQRNAELTVSNEKLQEALGTIKTLSGLVPICAWCHNKIRDADGWVDLVVYLRNNTEAEFTHGLCPDCFKAMQSEP
ncbi:MAG: hypothetical protein Kow0031_24310 [Anaerolineae bacterium]